MNILARLKTASPILCLSLMLSACGGSESDASLEQIVGVWDSSSADDVAYTVITAEGNMLAYDYQADSFGTGENCYTVRRFGEEILSTSVEANGSGFDVTMKFEEGFTGIISKGIGFDGNMLHLYDFDRDSAIIPKQPNTVIFSANTKGASESISRVSGVGIEDLNRCTSNGNLQNDDSGNSTLKPQPSFLVRLAEELLGFK